MRQRRLLPTTARIGLLALLTLQACAMRAPGPDITVLVENAKTAADHEAIAAYYDQEAADARKMADKHRKMQKSYTVGPSAAGRGSPIPLPQHCAALVGYYEKEAQEYAILAGAHRDMAKAAK